MKICQSVKLKHYMISILVVIICTPPFNEHWMVKGLSSINEVKYDHK